MTRKHVLVPAFGLRLALLGALAAALAGCAGFTVTGPPAGGTPYGLEERSHGHP